MEGYAAGSLRLAAVEGDVKQGSFMSGQIAGMVKKEQTAKEIIEEIFEEAEAVLGTSGRWVVK